MAKKTINKVLILTLSLAMLIIPGVCSHAENINNRHEGDYQGPYFSLIENYDTYHDLTDEVLSNTYWVDLVEKDIEFGEHPTSNSFGKYTYSSVFPKYISLPTDTAVNPIVEMSNDISHLVDGTPTYYEVNTLPVSGIVPSIYAMDTAFPTGLKYYAELPTDTLRNPFKFTKDEILRPEEIADPFKKLSVYSDLYVRGGGDS